MMEILSVASMEEDASPGLERIEPFWTGRNP